jgi:hypothetical protein
VNSTTGIEGMASHVTVISPGGVVNAAGGVGSTVRVRLTGCKTLPHASIAVQVSVTVPPHGPGTAEKVDGFEVPEIWHTPLSMFLKGKIEGMRIVPQAIVSSPGGIIAGRSAGSTVMVLETLARALPQASVAVQVSITVPPQADGIAVKVDGLETPDRRHAPFRPFV